MAALTHPLRISLGSLTTATWGVHRRAEPITVGIPLPSGATFSPAEIGIENSHGSIVRSQVRSTDLWPDGSIRWALLDLAVDVDQGVAREYAVRIQKGARQPPSLGIQVSQAGGNVRVETGTATLGFTTGGPFPVSSVSTDSGAPLDAGASGFKIDQDGRILDFRVSDVRVLDEGPLRAELEVRALPVGADPLWPIEVRARVELFAGTATVRIAFNILNRRRAQHPSNQWVLGDAGSVFFRSAALVLKCADPIRRFRCASEFGSPLVEHRVPFELSQESSGGENWDSLTHRNSSGRVPLRFRGYRLKSGDEERTANRASPIVAVETANGEITIAVPHFWENFPRSVTVEDGAIEVGLLPKQASELHELQGGEQKTHVVVVSFAEDTVSDPPLAWCHDPLLLYPTPAWCCGTGAVPFLIPAEKDAATGYEALVDLALDPDDGFLSKTEAADEYGWRNYGDLVADHESAYQPSGEAFVSHYNNQYDAIAGFAVQFFRTGDVRWLRLMDGLAHHVRDIDIYHTTEDKAAYNGGMFWHTLHYADAGTSTHRSYPLGRKDGGGPSSEHNYATGLMLHYFITGDRASREAAIGLARWVVDMDDGRLTVFRWLARGATGLASATGSMTYHGPGRGPANSIVACLVARRLGGGERFGAKADELIRRCIHPQDDIEQRNLPDAERRWYYTVFLQALGTFLQDKTERREFDGMFAYARASLLNYARWMATHEQPYLDRPEILEYPNETWAAQDMRKAEVFLTAAMHSTGEGRQTFLERARFFFDYSISTLTSMPTRRYTRPIVLMLSNGVRWGWFQQHASALPEPVDLVASDYGRPLAFEPQKLTAIRRAKWAIGLAILAVGVGIVALLSI